MSTDMNNDNIPYRHSYDVEIGNIVDALPAQGSYRRLVLTFLEPSVTDESLYLWRENESWQKIEDPSPSDLRVNLYRRRKEVFMETGRVWDALTVDVSDRNEWTASFTDRTS